MSPPSSTIKPTQKAVKDYYATLKDFEDQGATHEGAVSTAFQNLLANAAKKRKWTLIPFLDDQSEGHRIVPDGTIRDEFYITRGHWEAKDTDDDLEVEIEKKV